MGLVRCNIKTGVHAHAHQSGRITQRCHNSPRWETGLHSTTDVTHTEARGGFWEILKKSELRLDTGRVEMRPASGKTVGFRLLAETFVAGATCVGGRGDEKARIERMCISLSYVETFNSKVIKGFVPKLRSRYVFFNFRDSYVLSLWTFDVRFTHSHIMAMVHFYHSDILLANKNL